MANWREDFEFIYVLIMLVSGIVVFFVLYERTGIGLAGGGVAALVIAEGLAGYISFETDWAIGRWEKLAKRLENR